jgi:hypothetical protein
MTRPFSNVFRAANATQHPYLFYLVQRPASSGSSAPLLVTIAKLGRWRRSGPRLHRHTIRTSRLPPFDENCQPRSFLAFAHAILRLQSSAATRYTAATLVPAITPRSSRWPRFAEAAEWGVRTIDKRS